MTVIVVYQPKKPVAEPAAVLDRVEGVGEIGPAPGPELSKYGLLLEARVGSGTW
jgi:hypothetical protein